MKKYRLPGLVLIFLFLLLVAGLWVYKNQGRSSAEKGASITVPPTSRSGQTSEGVKPAWLKRYLTPGVVTRDVYGDKEVSLVNGYFQRLEPVAGSDDEYLVLGVKDQDLPRLRLLTAPLPAKNIKFATEVSVLNLHKTHNLTEAIHSLGTWSKLDEETRQSFFSSQQWLSALVYTDSLGKPIKDSAGAYFVRAVVIKGNP